MCFSGLLIKDICTVFPADMSRQYYLTLSKEDPYSTYGQKTGFWTPCTHYDHYVIVTTTLYSRPAQYLFEKLGQTPWRTLGQEVIAYQFLLKSNHVQPAL